MFLGIDLTSSESKPSACAVLDSGGSLQYLGGLATDAEMLALAAEGRARTAAIDAPLGFPKGMCCLEPSCPCESAWDFKGRVCERELLRRGIGLYITTKRSFIKPMIYRAMALAGAFEERGVGVIEVYPYAAKVCLFGKPIPKKTTREGLWFLRERLSELVGGLESYSGRLDHDLCDALIAAHTARLHAGGRTEALGLEEERQIVVPQGLF